MLVLQHEAAQVSIEALTPEGSVSGISGGMRFFCDDDCYYVVKGRQVGRYLVADRVVGQVAASIGYPVPETQLIHVSPELCDLISHHSPIPWSPGFAHGSRWIEGTQDSRSIKNTEIGENTQRFTDIAYLFGLTISQDRQYLYETQYPYRVWSHDHGLFLDIDLEWGEAKLENHIYGEVGFPPEIAANVNLSSECRHDSCQRLSQLTDDRIASIVGSVPGEWGFGQEEKVNLCEMLSVNRDRFISLKGVTSSFA